MMRRNLVIWSTSASHRARPAPPSRARRARRRARVLVLLGLVWLARVIRPRWRPLLAGTVLTTAGLVLRQGLPSVVFFPGVVLLLTAVFTPGDTEAAPSRLERELAVHSTQAERSDLQAILNRYPDSVTGELRDILARQSLAGKPAQSPR